MKFPQDAIIAGLRKRESSVRVPPGTGSKRPCRREPERPVQPLGVLPEAILVEEGESEEGNPPAGIPIGDLPHASSPMAPTAVISPIGDAEGPSGSKGPAEAPASGLRSPREAEASAPEDAPGEPPQPAQAPRCDVSYKSRLSETVLQLAILPKFQAKMRGLPLEESFDTMFTAALQMSNGLFVLREELIKAKSHNEDLSKELSEAKARESEASSNLRTAQEDNHAWRERAERELRTLDAKLTEVMARLLPTEEKLKKATFELKRAERRADDAEATARRVAEKLASAEKDAKDALDRAEAAETKAREGAAAAEARVREAIIEYKGSPDFAAEFREAVMDAFVQGFERCKRRLSRHFQLKDLEQFQPADDEETSGVEDSASEHHEEGPTTEPSMGNKCP